MWFEDLYRFYKKKKSKLMSKPNLTVFLNINMKPKKYFASHFQILILILKIEHVKFEEQTYLKDLEI